MIDSQRTMAFAFASTTVVGPRGCISLEAISADWIHDGFLNMSLQAISSGEISQEEP
jgi:hypothetical protein